MLRSSTMYKKISLFLTVILFVVCSSVCIQADAASLSIGASIKATSLQTGGSATIKATAKGGSSPYTYKFTYKINSGSWKTVKNYSSTNTATVKFTDGGTYTFRTYTKDKSGRTASCDLKASVKYVYIPMKNNSTISSQSINYGSTVTINAKVSNGTAPYTYQYTYQKTDESQVIFKNFTSQKSCTIKLPSSGYYTLKCVAKDKTNRLSTKTFSVCVKRSTGKALTNTSYTNSGAISLSSKLKITARGSGGKEPYKYSFYYKPTKGNWVTIKKNSLSKVMSYQFKSPDFYTIKCDIIDNSGKTVSKSLSVTVLQDTKKTLKNTSGSNVSTTDLIEKNTTIKLNAKAEGGTAPYKYSFYYKINNGTYKILNALSVKDASSIKLSTTGTYTIKFLANDSAKKNSVKYLTFKVIEPKVASVQSVSNATETHIGYGRTAKLTVPDKGASAAYQFYYKKSNETVWKRIRGYSSNRTGSFRPSELGTYYIRAYTKISGKESFADYTYVTEIPKSATDELKLINRARESAGLNALTLDNRLTFLANVRAEELEKKYSHTRPNGKSCFSVFDEYKVTSPNAMGENIAEGYSSVSAVMKAWMNSSGHKANILGNKFRKVGIGQNGLYWSQLFSD